MDDKLKKYPKTEKFEVIDTIGVPHSYCITARHVAWTADHHNGMLDEMAIEDSEKNGARCGICHGQLPYKEHKQALLVKVKTGQELKEVEKELKEYLLSIKVMCEADGFAGFAFKK